MRDEREQPVNRSTSAMVFHFWIKFWAHAICLLELFNSINRTYLAWSQINCKKRTIIDNISMFLRYELFLIIFLLKPLFAYAVPGNLDPELVTGKVLRYQMHYGQTQRLRVKVNKGFFARVVVEQINLDVAVTVWTPLGELVAHVDRPNGAYGPEAISFIASVTGTYMLTVQPQWRISDTGTVIIHLMERRPSNANDQKRIRAEHLCSQAETLRTKSQKASDKQAFEMFGESAALWRKLNDRYEAAVALYGRGITARAMGRYSTAELDLRESIALMHRLKRLYGEAAGWTALSWIYFYIGDDLRTRETAHRALSIDSTIHNWRGMGQCYYILGSIELRAGYYSQATSHFENARRLRSRDGDLIGATLAASKLAAALVLIGEYDRAHSLLPDVIRQFEALHLSYNRADALITMGLLFLQEGHNDQAAAVVHEALEFLDSTGNIMDTFNSRFLLARIAIHEQRLKDAATQLEALIADAESIRSQIKTDEERMSYTATTQDLYGLLSSVLLQLDEQEPGKGFSQRAFETFERATAQALIEKMTNDRPVPKSADETSLKFRPNVYRELQALVLHDSTLFAYFLNRYCSCAFVVTDTGVSAFHITDVNWVIQSARGRPQAVLHLSEMKRLSHILLAPVATELRNRSKITIVSQGMLDQLPIAILPDPNFPNVPMVKFHDIAHAPSASYLSFVATRPPTNHKKELLVFADPILDRDDPRLGPHVSQAGHDNTPSRLVFTRLEAEQITAELNKNRYLMVYGAQFNKKTIRSALLNGYEYIHFATHASEPTDVSGGFLWSSAFNETGKEIPHLLTTHDIGRLSLTGQVVILSACRSGGGRQISGEGIVGLARAFLYAGARAVIASKWVVDDRGTPELMKLLYRRLLIFHEPPATALANAQRQMRKRPGSTRADHWAAFGVYGMAF